MANLALQVLITCRKNFSKIITTFFMRNLKKSLFFRKPLVESEHLCYNQGANFATQHRELFGRAMYKCSSFIPVGLYRYTHSNNVFFTMNAFVYRSVVFCIDCLLSISVLLIEPRSLSLSGFSLMASQSPHPHHAFHSPPAYLPCIFPYPNRYDLYAFARSALCNEVSRAFSASDIVITSLMM